MLKQLERFLAEVVPSMPPEHVFYEDKAKPETLKQIQQMGTHDEWFGALINQGRFRQLAEDLLARARAVLGMVR